MRLSRRRIAVGLVALAGAAVAAFAAEGAAPAAPPLPTKDANNNPIRRARLTGHVSNYDEAKVGAYRLPDPLVLADGRPVRDADTWFKQRRPEILRAYENEIYGRVPATAPKATFEIVATETNALDGAATRQHIVARFGAGPDAPQMNLVLFLPAKATGPVPVMLHVSFVAHPSLGQPPRSPGGDIAPVADLLARGYAYATFRYTEFQLDGATTNDMGVQKMAYAPGQAKPAPGEWGTIGVWAWAASRVLDYFETQPALDAKRVALVGHSRLGKTALWASASDPRFAAVFASCSGELGASLARRDYGETVDDVAGNFPWWFAGNFQKYAGKWNDLPVDAHLLIALSAPRPVYVTGGTTDQWADPKGEFLAVVGAGPVYRLLGKKDVGATEMPPVDTPLITGNLGFHYHTGEHAMTAADWNAFLAFAEPHLRPGKNR